MSSLAQQLAGIASIDASRLTSRTGAPSSKSYLFTLTDFASQDLDAVYQIGLDGFAEIVELDPAMLGFEDDLFSEAARRTDRMMLNKEDNRVLDEVLGRCLRRLGKWIGVMACGRCLEWLIRRFRVHEMNAEILLQVFLPYHESQNFPRMLSILTIPATSPYQAPFAPLIRQAQPLPRSYIATAISPSKEASLRLLRDVIGSVQLALKEGVVHRAMLNFWSAIIVELLEKKVATEGVVKLLVEAFVEILSTPEAGQDVNAAVYPPLVLLTRTVRLADGPFLAVVSALLTPGTGASPAQRVLTLLVLLEDRKEWKGGLGPSAPEWLGKIKLLGQTLDAAMTKYGFESALSVILAEMVKRPDTNLKHLSVLVESSSLSQSSARIIAEGLISFHSPNTPEQSRKQVQPLLTSLRERHPATVDQAIVSAGAQHSVDSALRDNISTAEGFAEVYGADVAGRVQGVKRMYALLASGDQANMVSAKQALRARLVDIDLPVISTLYADPAAAIEALHDLYIDTLRPVFADFTTSMDIIRAHFNFITRHLIQAKPELDEPLLQQLVFPVLLSSRSRSLASPENSSSLIQELRTFSLTQFVAVPTSATMETVNQAVARALTTSILASDEFESWITFLLPLVDSAVHSEAILAQLVLAQIIATSAGEPKSTTASDTLKRIEPLLRLTPVKSATKAYSPTSDDLFRLVYDDNDSVAMTAIVLVSLIVEISKTPRPQTICDWLGTSAGLYQGLAHRIYSLANCGVLATGIATQILRSLLTQLGEEALIFFAAVWTTLSSASTLRVAALNHALAFVNAYKAGGSKGSDLQMIVPALLVALQDENKEVRSAGIAVLRAVNGSSQQQGETVYAVDTFYGGRSGQVQLLKPAYLQKYLSNILDNASDIVLDHRRLASIHTSLFSVQQTLNKKDKGINRAIIASIFSHLQAWRSLPPRLSILQSMAGVQDSAILRGVLPILVPLADDQSEEVAWLAQESEKDQAIYLAALLANLDGYSASLLVNPEGEAWKFIECLFSPDIAKKFGQELRSPLVQRMIDDVFASLPVSQKVAFIITLIHALHHLSSDERFSIRAALPKLTLESAGLVAIMAELSSPLETTLSKKRQKQDGDTEGDKLESAVSDLTVLLESQEWSKVPGNAALAAALMGVLSSLLTKRQVVKEGVDYLEQELLGAVLAMVEKIQDPSEVNKAHLGIEAIIKTIRSTSNPRISQRALLVAAELARLIPDAVLHNVMPIFTFMGAADYQRDDAYSFGVVERTVKGIVPVLVRKLRETAASGLELWTASASFLNIFTGMAGRLPKHRTLPFFTHLVDALGRSDYLAPVCMLLIDRTIGKSGRTGNSTAQAIELALGVAAPSDANTKLSVILDAINEVGRLSAELPEVEQVAFLCQISGDTQDKDTSIRFINALLTFSTSLSIQLAGKPVEQDSVQPIVTELVKISAFSRTTAVDHPEVAQGLQRCLQENMKLLSAEKFLDIVRQLSESDDQENIIRALDIFSERLPLVKKDVRVQSTAAIAAIIRRSADLLAGTAAIARAAMTAIRSVTVSAFSAEDSSLAAVLPKAINALSGPDAGIVNELLSLLDLSIRHLGPRVIPSIQPLLTATLALIARPGTSGNTAKAAFSVISATIETVPTFIGAKQLSTVLRAAMDNRVKSEESSSALIGTCSKKIPTKVLFPVVMELWKEVQRAEESVLEGFFHLLRLTLRNADRAALPGLIKTIFTFFLAVFDLRHKLKARAFDAEVINKVEESAIGSFLELVTKLNEATFKPLFTRLYDWAVIELAEGNAVDNQRLIERKTVLLHVTMGLLTKFRHLLSPYIGIMLPHLEELLASYADGSITDSELWTLLIRVLGKSFEVDDGAFWTEQLYLKLIPLLTSQIPVFPDQTLSSAPPSALSTTLANLAGSTTSEPILKAINLGICSYTREETVRIRLAALRCLDAVWEKQVDEMVGLVPETVSEYLAELIEDENGDVEKAARGVLARIERVTGSLQEYLE